MNTELPASAARKLGSGWTHLGSSVWEHPNGTRIHCLGRTRWPDGSTRCWTWDEEYAFRRLMGGKTKRALMAWALSLLPNAKDETRREMAQPMRKHGL